MTTRRRGSEPKLLEVKLAAPRCAEEPLHPGWVRATAILLRGLQRLEETKTDE